MRDLLSSLGTEHARFLRVAFLVALRLAPLFALSPFVGARVAPAFARAALLASLAFALTPIALGSADPGFVTHAFALLAARELALGLVFAFATLLPFAALDAGGRLVDGFRGASAGEIASSALGDRTTPLGEASALFGLALFFASGAHRVALFALSQSFLLAPIGLSSFAHDGAAASPVLSLFAWSMALALSFAAPALVALLLGELVLGAMGRAAPSLSTHFLGMPARACLGLATLALALPRIAAVLPRATSHVLDVILRLFASLQHV